MEFFFECLTGTEITWLTCILRLSISFIAGGILGLERKFRTQFVGMRTLILISVSSTVLMLLSIYMSRFFISVTGNNSDPARIAAQVVSGIGFLGGGAILRHGFNVKGLTSAAIIWAAAALGLAIGAGFIIPVIFALIICLFSLIFIERFEEHVFPAEQLKTLRIECDKIIPNDKTLEYIAADYGVVVTSLQGAFTNSSGETILLYDVRIPKYIDFSAFFSHLYKEFSIISVSLE